MNRPSRVLGNQRRRISLFEYEVEKPIVRYANKSKKAPSMVFGWGSTLPGCLGLRRLLENPAGIRRNSIPAPIRLPFAFPATAAAAGHAFSLLASSKAVYGCGTNHQGQLGPLPTKGGKGDASLFVLEPRRIPLPDLSRSAERILSIAAGQLHSLVATDRRLWALGSNKHGQLGRPIVAGEAYAAVRSLDAIPLGRDRGPIRKVQCGFDASFVLLESGRLLSFGSNGMGQLGRDGDSWRIGEVQIPEPVIDVACTAEFVLALTKGGDVYGWGSSDRGQLLSTLPVAFKPTRLNLDRIRDEGDGIVGLTAGDGLGGLVTGAGDAWVWGLGSLGLGPKVHFTQKPVKIPRPLFGCSELSPDVKVVRFVSKGIVSAAITNDVSSSISGSLYTWGENKSDQLGLSLDKSRTHQTFPMKVPVPAYVREIELGSYHCLAIARDFA